MNRSGLSETSNLSKPALFIECLREGCVRLKVL